MKIPVWTDKKLMKGAEPIFLKGTNKVGVLFLHGWSSSPQEFNAGYFPSTAEYINKLGYTVYVPLRRGHGTEPKDILGLTWEDWIEDAREHYDFLAKKVGKIVVGGMSMGANLALQLAVEKPVVGVIPMGTGIFPRLHWLFVPLVWFSRNNTKMRKKTYYPSDRVIAMKKTHYTRYPSNSLFENLRASVLSRVTLPKVKAPILIMHSANDHVVHPRSAKYVYRRVSSVDKDLILIEDSYHSFTTDKWVDEANRIMGEFIDRITKK